MKKNLFFILITLLSYYSKIHCIKPITSSTNFLELSRKTGNIVKFTDNLRQNHVINNL